MPWLRLGDDSDSHPILMRVYAFGPAAEHEIDAWSRADLIFGYVLRCAVRSAGHLTDYFVSRGTAMYVGGPNWEWKARDAIKAGLWKKAKVDGVDGFEIVAIEEFIHIRLARQVAHDKKRDADRRNPSLTWAVRLRDGDACRYCEISVNWNDRKGARGGTYDHVEPAEPTTVENYVVCCRACNAGREQDPANYQLQPPPLEPFYYPKTLELLAQQGLVPKRPGTQPGHASQSTTPRDPVSDRPTRHLRPVTEADTATTSSGGNPDPRPDPETGKPGSAGSGSGLVGSGRVSTGSDRVGSGAQPRSKRKRARRGRPRSDGTGSP